MSKSVKGKCEMDEACVKAISLGHGCADEELINEIKSFSMLHHQALRILWELAARSNGPIIELGPYIGGSTVAMALARKEKPTKIITVEKGGDYLTHASLPSENILGDLQSNLERFAVADKVTIVEGHNNDPKTLDWVSGLLAGEKAPVIFIDSDGRVDRDFPLYRPFLADGAFVVLDDYESKEAPEKSGVVRPFVENGIRECFFLNLGVYKWGTWVGRYIC
jgi:predicted O-methyltransferase YrrM